MIMRVIWEGILLHNVLSSFWVLLFFSFGSLSFLRMASKIANLCPPESCCNENWRQILPEIHRTGRRTDRQTGPCIELYADALTKKGETVEGIQVDFYLIFSSILFFPVERSECKNYVQKPSQNCFLGHFLHENRVIFLLL